MRRRRLDALLVERGLAISRDRAQRLVMAGAVLVDDEPVTKAGQTVPDSARVRLREPDHPYVSRGALKLLAALEQFKIDAGQKVALDIGSSTGGFTEVLLARGALRVHAVDVGQNQLDWRLRNDPRVVVHEKTNARHIQWQVIGEPAGMIVVDVSFISLEKILPALIQFSLAETDWITLIKPQFEVGPASVGKGGIVVEEAARREALERIARFGESLGLTRVGLIDSPITGKDGNQEYLAHWKRR